MARLTVSACDYFPRLRGEHPREQPFGDDLTPTTRTDPLGRVSLAATSDRALAMVITDARPGDIVVTMGTGTVTELGAQILTELSPLGRPTTEPEPAAHR